MPHQKEEQHKLEHDQFKLTLQTWKDAAATSEGGTLHIEILIAYLEAWEKKAFAEKTFSLEAARTALSKITQTAGLVRKELRPLKH